MEIDRGDPHQKEQGESWDGWEEDYVEYEPAPKRPKTHKFKTFASRVKDVSITDD